MIKIVSKMAVKPGNVEEFKKRIAPLVAASRAEAGNIQYDYYVPADGSDDMLLVEKWQDADVLALHVAQPHMVRLRELKAEFTTDTIIEKYVPAE